MGLSSKDNTSKGAGSVESNNSVSQRPVISDSALASLQSVVTQEAAIKIIESIMIFMTADSLTRLTLEMVAHSLCADQIQQLRIEFQVNVT
jgi:hypothetical protein